MLCRAWSLTQTQQSLRTDLMYHPRRGKKSSSLWSCQFQSLDKSAEKFIHFQMQRKMNIIRNFSFVFWTSYQTLIFFLTFKNLVLKGSVNVWKIVPWSPITKYVTRKGRFENQKNIFLKTFIQNLSNVRYGTDNKTLIMIYIHV